MEYNNIPKDFKINDMELVFNESKLKNPIEHKKLGEIQTIQNLKESNDNINLNIKLRNQIESENKSKNKSDNKNEISISKMKLIKKDIEDIHVKNAKT